jgi:hypothetical protein
MAFQKDAAGLHLITEATTAAIRRVNEGWATGYHATAETLAGQYDDFLAAILKWQQTYKVEALAAKIETEGRALAASFAAGRTENVDGLDTRIEGRRATVARKGTPVANDVVREIRAREIRDFVRGLPELDRQLAIEAAGRDANFEVLDALAGHPLGFAPITAEWVKAARAKATAVDDPEINDLLALQSAYAAIYGAAIEALRGTLRSFGITLADAPAK